MSERVSEFPDVIDNQEKSRFELALDPEVAELIYRLSGKRLVLIHTGVPFELEGHGIGGKLVTAAVDRAEREGLTLASDWLRRHPETAKRALIDWDE